MANICSTSQVDERQYCWSDSMKTLVSTWDPKQICWVSGTEKALCKKNKLDTSRIPIRQVFFVTARILLDCPQNDAQWLQSKRNFIIHLLISRDNFTYLFKILCSLH